MSRYNKRQTIQEEIFGYSWNPNISELNETPPWMKLPKSEKANIDTIRDLKFRNCTPRMVNRTLHIITNNLGDENPFIILQTLGFVWDLSWTKHGLLIFKHLSGERYVFSGTAMSKDKKMIIKMRNLKQTQQEE